MDILQTFNSKIAAGKATIDIRPGQTIRVHQKIKEGTKTRTQIFEGIVIARKHGNGPSATITVRKISNGIGVERIFPLHTPSVVKFEIMKTARIRQAKLYYLRDKTARETRKKTKLMETKVSAASAPKIETKETAPAQET